MPTVLTAEHAFAVQRARVNEQIETLLDEQIGPVGDAMRYACLGCGQRIRPLLALLIAESLGQAEAKVMRAAGAVELMHCASLIVDDLPCMDDDAVRRNRPAVHVAYGEAVALLASFSLVSVAARAVTEFPALQRRLLAMLDSASLTGGQALDLAMTGAEKQERRMEVIYRKTVPLFRLAVEAGMTGAAVSESTRWRLLRFGCELGAAYQMIDDYLDGDIGDAACVRAKLEQALTVLGADDGTERLHALVRHLNARLD